MWERLTAHPLNPRADSSRRTQSDWRLWEEKVVIGQLTAPCKDAGGHCSAGRRRGSPRHSPCGISWVRNPFPHHPSAERDYGAPEEESRAKRKERQSPPL